jgi:hypothetical protein
VSARLIAVAAGLALLAGGCGGSGQSRRDAVSHYIDQVNLIEKGLAKPARTISVSTRELAKPNGDRAGAERRLRVAAARIDSLRLRLARARAPAEAARLRSLLLELLRQEAGLARELAGYAAFVPALQAALRPLPAAGARLKKSSGTTAAAQADVLDAYAATVAVAARRLRALHPPALAAPVRATEVRTLERVHNAAIALARALRAKRVGALSALVHDLDVAAAGNGSLAAQRARIAAVRAYDRRVSSLDSLTARIYRERARLQTTLD